MAEKILIGANPEQPLYVFENPQITACTTVLSSSLSGDELAIDQFMPVVYSAAYIRVGFRPKGSTGLITADGRRLMVFPGTGFLDKLPYSTPIWYYSNDALVGKFYAQRIVRTGRAYFDILAVSAIGILDGQDHYGGIYTGQTVETVAREIIGDSFAFSCADNVAGILIYGWLPIGSKRANLHQLLFACGVSLDKDANGDIYFRFPDTDAVKNVPDSRIFIGGNVDYMIPATRAEVTEHIFEALSTDETVTLYDNTQGGELADNTRVSFRDAPIHNLVVTGTLQIVESGVNYAVVSGTGTLTGQKYTHITRVVSKSTDSGGEDKLVTVTDATLVSVANSENVASRVLSYYSSARTIQADVVLNGEKPGEQLSFNNAFGDPERAFLSSMDINAGSFLRASCELVTGYLPSGGGNNYTRVITLSGRGVWTVPEDIPVDSDGYGKIRVAIIQGGWGGSGGYRGIDGETTENFYDRMDPPYNLSTIVYSSRNPGVGGLPGTPGKPGKVLVLTLRVRPGQNFSFASGVGGIGGKGQTADAEPQAGAEGGETTFGGYTSANGSIIDGGYFDVIENVLYAHTGDNGTSGNSGYLGGYNLTDYGEGPGGSAPFSGKWFFAIERGFTIQYQTSGAGSGGSAYGAAGLPGETRQDTYEEDLANDVTSESNLTGTRGGNGATPIKPTTPDVIGKGGTAGHGGGGGGTGGTLYCASMGNFLNAKMYSPGGVAGNGSDGGDGADGGIVIYL